MDDVPTGLGFTSTSLERQTNSNAIETLCNSTAHERAKRDTMIQSIFRKTYK